MRVSRRQLLIGQLAAMIAAALPGQARAQAAHGPILAAIDRNFPGLRAEREELQRFAEDLLTHLPGIARHPGYAAYPSWSWLQDLGALRRLVPGSLALDVDAFEGLVVTYFLMSTDFFDVGDDPQASVTYVAFGDPYVSGCANRLARFD